MASHEYYQDLIPLYALDSLSDEERLEVSKHLKECASCLKLYQQERAIVQMIPRSVDSVEPSRETKLKLFARVDADLARQSAPLRAPVLVQSKEKPRRSWFATPAFAFAVIALIALVSLLGWSYFNPQAVQDRQVATILSNPNVQQVPLGGTKDAPNAIGIVYMVPGQSQAVLRVSGLQPLPQDKGYEFWFFKGGNPQPSNVFTVNPDGTTTVIVSANDRVENFKGWGVTIEPRQGVPKPTGPIVIVGGL